MQNYQEYQTPASSERRFLEHSPLDSISDSQMVQLIACPGVLEKFNLDSLTLADNYQHRVNPTTQAQYLVREGGLVDRNGENYILQIKRDLASAVVQVDDPRTGSVILKVGLRDRQYDGTPLATPSGYLQAFDDIHPDQIPQRSQLLGTVGWHYSSQRDFLKPGQRAVEISVVSSDPAFHLTERLRAKSHRRELWVRDGDTFAAFIKDPFASLPEGNPPENEALDSWYSMWWQVTKRILDGKSVPLPGQTSQKAFDGFLQHAVLTGATLLRGLNYTHFSAVPTWYYVWTKFQRLGFEPDHEDMHHASRDFFERVARIAFPDAQTGQPFNVKGSMNQKALISWLSVFPYALQCNPLRVPQLSIPLNEKKQFDQVFIATRDNLLREDGTIYTYPLAPGRNIWYSLPLHPHYE